MLTLHNYINGAWLPPQQQQYFDNINPATGEVSGNIPDSDAADIEQAVAAAQAAFPQWSAMPPDMRAKHLLQLAAAIEHHLEHLAAAESADNGKPISVARSVDIPRAAANFRFFAQAVTQFSTETHHQPHFLNYTLRQPIGVVGCISPWNLPLYLFTWKIAPALAAGNCVVAKPSEITPVTAYLLSKLCEEVAFPKGVLNIVHGSGARAGQAIVEHRGIKAISFTGGTATGRKIAQTAAPLFKKISLELGGKNPALVFADCDFDATVSEITRSAFSNQGQICLCNSRIYVERSIYEPFKTAFIEKVKKLRTGNPALPDTQIGAVVSEAHRDKILSYIALAQQEGGQVLCGGTTATVEAPCQNGFFIQPTVIEGLTTQCRVNQEEIFGPVVTLQPFDTESEALMWANSSDYGLAATVWTQNLERAHRLAETLQSGIVWVNCWMHRDLRTPFGGVKHSGVGREGGFEALRFFTEAKNITIRY
ncbi:MAG: aldehyde dehydrogenase [Sphingobacteriales bacterium]|nr:aldehyde dehydrogenase [Sphingobacteriales bacterium]